MSDVPVELVEPRAMEGSGSTCPTEKVPEVHSRASPGEDKHLAGNAE